MSPKESLLWSVFKAAAVNWISHKDARLGAALAYYSIFSLGPLLVIAVAIAGLLFEQEAVRAQISQGLEAILGHTGAKAVDALLVSASKQHEGIIASILGIVAMVIAAIGVVVQ